MNIPVVTKSAAPSARASWTRGQRVKVFATALLVLVVGVGAFVLDGAKMAAKEPPTFHLDEVPPDASGIHFVHALPAFDSFFDNVYPFLAAVGAAGCVSDVDRDGRLDLLLTTEGEGAQNAFYQNVSTSEGIRFVAVSVPIVEDVNHDGFTTDCVFADVDNDGFEDLFLGRAASAPRLYLNVAAAARERGEEEQGAAIGFTRTFVDVTERAGLPKYMNGFAASFLDINRDGNLDLVTADYFRARYAEKDVAGAPYIHNRRLPNAEGQGRMMPNNWGRADNGGEKHLLLGRGDGTFDEQPLDEWGFDQTRFTFDIGTADINADGFTDLYFANDFGPDQLYLNRNGETFVAVQGRFPTDVGRDSFKGMNADLHDVDNDGFPEIYVTNVFHPALPEGNLFWANRPHASGDPFLRSFKNVAADNGTKDGGWGWGAKFVDLDNDRDVDVVATNGYISGDPDREYWYAVSRLISGNADYIADSVNWPPFDGRSMSGHQVSHVFVRGEHRYFDRAADVGVKRVFDGRGVIIADFDVDGRPDVLFVPQGAPPQLLRNRFVDSNAGDASRPPAFVGFVVEGDGVGVAKTAVGTRVVVRQAGEKPQYREVNAGNGMTSQSMGWLHVGLGDNAAPVDVTVLWTNGQREEHKGVVPGAYFGLMPTHAPVRLSSSISGGHR